MAIEAIPGEGANNYRTKDVSAKVSRLEFHTAEPVAEEQAENTQENENDEGARTGNKPSESTIRQAISDINKKINPNTIAEYGYHEKTNRVTIKIVDKDTDKVIKEFPADETLDMIAKVWELAGMFLDEKG